MKQHLPESVQKCRKVPVLYYLCQNRQLEHPHFIEVPLVSPDGLLYLRDVIEKLDSLRGRGMASMYSWSCKRSYKNAFVWNDLGEDDLIVPADENEYVLKGSELVEEHNSGRFVPARNMKVQSVERLCEDIISREANISQEDDGCHSLTKYKIYKSTHGLADASTQTDDNGHVDSLTNDSTPSSSGACSSAHKTDTLESLLKADNFNFKTSEKLEEQEEEQDEDDDDDDDDDDDNNNNEYQVPANTKIRALLQLISCGSLSSQDHNFSQALSCRLNSKSSSRVLSSSVMLGELDCLTENPRFSGMKSGDKQYFSGSLVETNMLKKEEISNLKRSSSFSANWINACDSTLTRTKCIPRSIMGSLSKHSRTASMRFFEDSNSCILSPCLAKTPSKRMESFGDNKENVIKIEERLSSGARVIIHLEANNVS